ncbi:MAG: XdhC family protein [Candidatus Omnitrophica bacterium]|nr:XdhC family protein [Candidatus Omnitrophota bacterium]
MDSIIKKAYEASTKGQSYAFATVIETTIKGTPRKAGAKMVVLADGSTVGTIGGGKHEQLAIKECQKALKAGRSYTVTYDCTGKNNPVCGGQIKVFIEPFAGVKDLIICGAGHIALPLSVIGKMLNMKVTIIDNRKSFANAKRFPHVDKILHGNHVQKLKKISITHDTYIVIATHGHDHDYDCLKTVAKSDAQYIGVISSKTKRAKFLGQLKNEGVSQKFLKRIHMPCGIDIGAQTPEEIALSISAQIVANINKERLNSEKFKY